MHLIVDGYGGDVQKMQELETIFNFLDKYPSQIGMTKIAPPYVFRYIGTKPQDWGISGFVLIAESHISIHTFPDRAYINIDVFSCKRFDSEKAIQDLKEALGLTEVRSYVLDRGLEQFEDLESISAPGVEIREPSVSNA